MPRLKHADALEQRQIRQGILKREVLVESRIADGSRDVRTGQDRLDRRREDETRAIDKVVKRLDPIAVSCEQEPLGDAVPDRKREHAVQALDGVLTPLDERLKQD